MNASVVHGYEDFTTFSLDPKQSKYLIYSGPDSSVLLTIWMRWVAAVQGLGGIDVHGDGAVVSDGVFLIEGNITYAGGTFGGDGSRTFLIPRVRRIEVVINPGTVKTYQQLGGKWLITAWSL